MAHLSWDWLLYLIAKTPCKIYTGFTATLQQLIPLVSSALLLLVTHISGLLARPPPSRQPVNARQRTVSRYIQWTAGSSYCIFSFLYPAWLSSQTAFESWAQVAACLALLCIIWISRPMVWKDPPTPPAIQHGVKHTSEKLEVVKHPEAPPHLNRESPGGLDNHCLHTPTLVPIPDDQWLHSPAIVPVGINSEPFPSFFTLPQTDGPGDIESVQLKNASPSLGDAPVTAGDILTVDPAVSDGNDTEAGRALSPSSTPVPPAEINKKEIETENPPSPRPSPPHRLFSFPLPRNALSLPAPPILPPPKPKKALTDKVGFFQGWWPFKHKSPRNSSEPNPTSTDTKPAKKPNTTHAAPVDENPDSLALQPVTSGEWVTDSSRSNSSSFSGSSSKHAKPTLFQRLWPFKLHKKPFETDGIAPKVRDSLEGHRRRPGSGASDAKPPSEDEHAEPTIKYISPRPTTSTIAAGTASLGAIIHRTVSVPMLTRLKTAPTPPPTSASAAATAQAKAKAKAGKPNHKHHKSETGSSVDSSVDGIFEGVYADLNSVRNIKIGNSSVRSLRSDDYPTNRASSIRSLRSDDIHTKRKMAYTRKFDTKVGTLYMPLPNTDLKYWTGHGDGEWRRKIAPLVEEKVEEQEKVKEEGKGKGRSRTSLMIEGIDTAEEVSENEKDKDKMQLTVLNVDPLEEDIPIAKDKGKGKAILADSLPADTHNQMDGDSRWMSEGSLDVETGDVSEDKGSTETFTDVMDKELVPLGRTDTNVSIYEGKPGSMYDGKESGFPGQGPEGKIQFPAIKRIIDETRKNRRKESRSEA